METTIIVYVKTQSGDHERTNLVFYEDDLLKFMAGCPVELDDEMYTLDYVNFACISGEEETYLHVTKMS